MPSDEPPETPGLPLPQRAPRVGARTAALRNGLPFGAVMATAAASALAQRCGLPQLFRPLLGLAILQAGWITAVGIVRHRGDFRAGWRAWWALGPVHEHSGIHTIPLGLAMIASGLLGISDAVVTRGTVPLAQFCLSAAWITAVIAVGRFIAALTTRDVDLHALDGSWFLVPAVLLGGAIATDRLATRLGGPSARVLWVFATGSALIGWAGYGVLAIVALIRIRRHGLGGAPRSLWWIVMGCAGLAAAALSQVLRSRPLATLPSAWLSVAILLSVSVAIVLAVPVLALSTKFLLRQCTFRAAGSWPPTFSTAVLSFGALQAGEVLRAPILTLIGQGAAYATLVFWIVTAGWNVTRAWRLRGGDASASSSLFP